LIGRRALFVRVDSLAIEAENDWTLWQNAVLFGTCFSFSFFSVAFYVALCTLLLFSAFVSL